MDQKEKQTPFQKGEIQALESTCAEIPRILSMPCRKKVTGSDEEQRHVERIDDACQKAGGFCMAYHHEYYRNPFADGDGCVSFLRGGG